MKGKRILTGLLLASLLAAGFPAAAEETPETAQPELIQQEETEVVSVSEGEEGGTEEDGVEENEDPVLAFEDITSKTGISDETFYGKYDLATDTWTVKPYFNYDKYPEMAAVKQAVMQVTDGDYSAVKEELLQYYRDKRNRQNVPMQGSPNTQAAFFGYAMKKNFYFHPSWPMLGYFNVNGTPDYYSVDVTHQWDSIKTAPDHRVSIILMASEKDGNTAEFESREAAHPPILEVESNGVVTTLTAIKDATVIAGKTDGVNYGKEPTLLVEESATTIGKSEPTDSNTKRSHIQFDISDISTTDAITRITLKVYGKNATSNEEKEIFAMKTPNNAWEENVISFYYLDKTQVYEHMAYSWDGEDSVRYMRPKYQGFRLREELERFETWLPMLLGMYIQGTENNEDYAYTAIRHWVGWLNQSGTNPRGPGYVIPLDHGCRSIALPRALAWLIMSEHMTPDVWSATLKYMWKSGDIMVTNNYAINDTRNAGVVAARGLHMMNCYYDEFATYDKWLAKTRAKIQAVANSALIDAEGGYGEGSLAYASMTVNNMFGYTTPNTDTNVQDLPFNDRAAYDKVEDLAVYLMDMSMPGYKESQWGDGGNYTSGYTNSFNTVLQEYDNPYLKYAVGDEGGVIPPYTSVLYKNYRRMVMRSGWGENDNYLFTDLDGATVAHTHKDDNSIIVNAYGQYLLSDQLFFSYGTGPVKTYLESTRAHNTIEIDNSSQGTAKRGNVKYWESNDIYDHTTNESLAYQGGKNEKHTRDILYIRPGFWIVGDYVKPTDSDTAQHNYKQHWHMLPDANISLDEGSLTTRTNFQGTANIQIVQANPEDMDAKVNNGFYIGTTADYVTYEQQAVGPVIFNTILYPEKAGANVEVTAETLPLENVKNNGATAMHINIDDHTENKFIRADYYLVHDEAQKTVRSFANYETDARSAYVERDAAGNLTRLIVQGGTYVKDLDKNVYLFKSKTAVEQVGFELAYGTVTRDTSAKVDMDKLTVYADNTSDIVNVYEGTKGANAVKSPVSYKMSGRYVYFGAAPIEEETEKPDATPKPTPTQKPDSGVTGGISGGGGGGGGIGSVKPQTVVTPPTVTPKPTGTGDVTPPPTVTPNPTEQMKEEIQGHWGEAELLDMIDKGILKGSGGTLSLEAPVTRAEFITMLVRGLELETKPYTGGFADVADGDWFAEYVQTAVEHGIASGMGDGTFAGDKVISREEMAKMLVNAFEAADEGKTVLGETMGFGDSAAISGWALEYVEKATGYGLLQGDEEKRFQPQSGAQRDQAAVAVGRMLEKLKTHNEN